MTDLRMHTVPTGADVRSDKSVFLRITIPLAGVNFLNQASRALIATIGPIVALEFSLSATELGLLAATFFATSLALAYFASQAGQAPEAGIPDARLIEQQNSVPTLDEGTQSLDNSAPVLEEAGE